MRYLITGGAGFVGSSLAIKLAVEAKASVTVLDNLKRRGSEQNISRLVDLGVEFVHGDVRNQNDLDCVDGNFDVLIEASAEPSVHAGVNESPRYVIDTNLGGAINCLEYAKRRCASLVFLSTSRVYSLDELNNIPLSPGATRFELQDQNTLPGLNSSGISEGFDTTGARSFYGASKLAAELLCQEYAAHSKLKVVINRCGVIAGPGQFGKTDQGVFTLWVARHFFSKTLQYTGYGGKGLQVRDLLHPQDLYSLIEKQVSNIDAISGNTYNIGGGQLGSTSLSEFTTICENVVGNRIKISSEPTTSSVDIPWYISDHSYATRDLDWSPAFTPTDIAKDIFSWIHANPASLSKIFQ
jgi:CDP-paratose 2-epimerase